MQRQTLRLAASAVLAATVATAQTEQPFFIEHSPGGTCSYSRSADGWVTNATFKANGGFTIAAIGSGSRWYDLAPATTSATNIAYPMSRLSAIYAPATDGGRLSADHEDDFGNTHDYQAEIVVGAGIPNDYALLSVTAHVLVGSQSASNFRKNKVRIQLGDGEAAVDVFDSETSFGQINGTWHLVSVPFPKSVKPGQARLLNLTVQPGDYVAWARAIKIHSLWVRPAELSLHPPSAVDNTPAILTLRACPGLPLIIESAPGPQGPWTLAEQSLVPGNGMIDWADELSTSVKTRYYRAATLATLVR